MKNFSYDKKKSLWEYFKVRRELKELDSLSLPQEIAKDEAERALFWHDVKLVVITIFLLTAFHCYVLPNLI